MLASPPPKNTLPPSASSSPPAASATPPAAAAAAAAAAATESTPLASAVQHLTDVLTSEAPSVRLVPALVRVDALEEGDEEETSPSMAGFHFTNIEWVPSRESALSWALCRWRGHSLRTSTAQWLGKHSWFMRFRTAVLQHRSQRGAAAAVRGPRGRSELERHAHRCAVHRALRRWQAFLVLTTVGTTHNLPIATALAWGGGRDQSSRAVREVARAVDAAAHARGLEMRTEAMELAQAMQQLHARCLDREKALRRSRAPSPLLAASAHAVTAAAAAAATAAGLAAPRRTLSQAHAQALPDSESRDLLVWALQEVPSHYALQPPSHKARPHPASSTSSSVGRLSSSACSSASTFYGEQRKRLPFSRSRASLQLHRAAGRVEAVTAAARCFLLGRLWMRWRRGGALAWRLGALTDTAEAASERSKRLNALHRWQRSCVVWTTSALLDALSCRLRVACAIKAWRARTQSLAFSSAAVAFALAPWAGSLRNLARAALQRAFIVWLSLHHQLHVPRGLNLLLASTHSARNMRFMALHRWRGNASGNEVSVSLLLSARRWLQRRMLHRWHRETLAATNRMLVALFGLVGILAIGICRWRRHTHKCALEQLAVYCQWRVRCRHPFVHWKRVHRAVQRDAMRPHGTPPSTTKVTHSSRLVTFATPERATVAAEERLPPTIRIRPTTEAYSTVECFDEASSLLLRYASSSPWLRRIEQRRAEMEARVQAAVNADDFDEAERLQCILNELENASLGR
jgi:hypothetical protein